MISIIHSPATIEDIANTVKKVDQNTLVIWDVDGVLLIGADRILHSENIHDGLVHKYTDYIANKYKLNQTEIELFTSKLLIQRKPQLVDTKVLDIMQHLESNNIYSIALTYCYVGALGEIKSFADYRINELAKIGAKLNGAFCNYDTIELNTLPKVSGYYLLWKQGILFCLEPNKGKVLVALLGMVDWHPIKVIFIDDKIGNLQSVQEELKEKNIQFIGFHYTGALNLPRKINEKLVEFQYEYLIKYDKWLSDQQALIILNNVT
jgi:Protein of unknown function (DUF2608)